MKNQSRLAVMCIALLFAIFGAAVVMTTQTFANETETAKQEKPHIEVKTVKELVDSQEVASAVKFSIQADGETKTHRAIPMTVAEALKMHHISVGENDIVTPALDEMLTSDTEIIVQRITEDTQTEQKVIKFKTKKQKDDNLVAGKTKVIKKGENGLAEITYRITYCDGEEIQREKIDYKLLKKPVTKIVAEGTGGTINGRLYSKKFTVKAYSYTGGGTTASGKVAAEGRIAVDPSVIPLGTQVYVEGYGFAEACDTGGDIKGNTIDVYYNSASKCRSWGRRYVTIYILK